MKVEGKNGRDTRKVHNSGPGMRAGKFFIQWIAMMGLLLGVMATACLADVTIDNGDPGSSSTGSWSVSGGTTPYGSDSLWARDGATYTWQFSGETAGMYNVHVWWSAWSSRSDSVPVQIDYSGGQASIILDQSTNAGIWNSIGTYYFDGSGSVTITAASGSTVSTAADAVWFEFVSANSPPVATIDAIAPSPANPGDFITFTGSGFDAEGSIAAYEWSSDIDGVFGSLASFSTPSLSTGVHTISLKVQDADGVWSAAATKSLIIGAVPTEIIIDNRDAQTTQTGIWEVSAASGFYGVDSVWSRDGATFSWNFDPPQTGEYQVVVHCTAWASRSTSVPLQINYKGGTTTVSVNQQVGGGEWKDLGQYPFEANNGGSIMVTAQPGPSSTCADAVRFLFVSTNTPPVATIDSVLPSPASVGELVTFSGHGTDVDGIVAAYRWESNVSGLLSDQPNFSTATLAEAIHNISFKVQDDMGSWSQPAPFVLQVGNPPNQLPVATLDSITPNPANIGQMVSFIGSGVDPDGSVVGYRWESDIDGLLSESASFSTVSLSEGVHTISFQVVDDQAGVSATVTQPLTVQTPPPETVYDNGAPETSSAGAWSPSVAPDYYGSDSLWARDGATYTWTFAPAESGYYEVFIWYTQWATRATNVPVNIATEAGPVYKQINQQTNGGQWNSLGEYIFNAGTSYPLTLTAAGSLTSTSADAVKFVRKTLPSTPVAEFLVDKQLGGVPLITKFEDMSFGAISSWYWSFGDGGSSTERNPEHKYTEAGLYTISLTVSNSAGSHTETKTGYVNIAAGNTENIYLCDGYSSGDYFMINNQNLFRDLGVDRINGVWVYTNSQQGRTYYIHHVNDAAAMERAMKEDGSHIIFDGHSNFGLGASFASPEELAAQQIDNIYYIDDDRLTNYSTDMVSLKVDGMKYGQAYPNWNPVFRDGTSGIMPYTFTDGTPPYNYYLSYTIPGDPTTYKVELSDGSYLERFPDASTPAWFSSEGTPPDPVVNPEYFITNNDIEYNHADFIGAWPLAKVPHSGYTGKAGYLGYNYQVIPAGNGASKATFTVLFNHSGDYQVMASWFAAAENASNTKYVIQHSGGATTVTVDQRTTALMNPLGVFHFDKGAYKFEISDDANGNVIADAFILQYVNDPVGLLQAEFSAEVHAGDAPLAVAFVDQSQLYSGTDFSQRIVSRHWDFGDGTSSELTSPSHSYSTPGVYSVSLTVTDSMGNEDTEIKDQFVAVGTTVPLKAEFSAEKRTGAERTVVKFQDQSNGDITSWQWDFGDGTTSTEQNPTHLYKEAGVAFTVTLQVSGPAGNSTETEVDFVHNMVGINYVDNTFHTKPHFYSGSLIRFGKVIVDTGDIKIPEADLKYARFFYGGCNSANYYVGTLHSGIMIFSTSDVYDEYSSTLYLRNYLAGRPDQEIMYEMLQSEPIWEYYDFNLKPPSLR